MSEKRCAQCGVTKSTEEFYRQRSRKDGLQGSCKECQCTRLNIHALTKPRPKVTAEAAREYHLSRAYGITTTEYDTRLKQQSGVCAICEQPCPSGRRLAVDHCHTTLSVRGLLCKPCNTSLGNMKDSPELLRRAATYIEDSHNGAELHN